MATVLGLDVGEKKIGVAVGDIGRGLAFPRPALLVDDWSEAWGPIERLVNEERISVIVIGWPLEALGRAGPQTASVERFIAELKRHVSVSITRLDERLTTQAVQREQRQRGRPLKRGQEDSLAAQLLVETYLQRSHGQS